MAYCTFCWSKVAAQVLISESCMFSVSDGVITEVLFMLFSIYNTVYWVENE